KTNMMSYRALSYIAERLTGVFIYKKIKEGMTLRELNIAMIDKEGAVVDNPLQNKSIVYSNLKLLRRWLFQIKLKKNKKVIRFLGIYLLKK
ncbi:MAG: hypothetical protein JXQ74_04215, partial [Alphaproteobacteria bacterium]|nr:hypothetical protein [Alphaproteobacteria bacterium]